MKNNIIVRLIMGVLSIGCLQAQSDFGQKQHHKEHSANNNFEIQNKTNQSKHAKHMLNYTLPFTENFENAGFPPADWVKFIGSNGAGNIYQWQQTSNGYSGNGAWVDYDDYSGTIAEDWLVTPLIDLGTNTVLSFFEKQDYTTNYGSNYYIKISTNSQTNYTDFTTIESYTESNFSTNYTSRQIDLSAYDGQSVYIAFVMTNDDGDSWYIDNILIEEDAGGGGVAGGDLVISEIAYPVDSDGSKGRFVELYNSGTTAVNLSKYYLVFNNSNNRINLSGTVQPGETFIYAPSSSEFNSKYGFSPDQSGSFNSSWFTGIDAIALYYKSGGKYYARDTYGIINTSGSGQNWEYSGKHAVRSVDATTYQTSFDITEWEISTAYYAYRDVTPGNHNQNYYWTGSYNNEWDEYRNWTPSGGGIQAIPDIGANVVIPSGTSNNPDLGLYIFPYFFNSITVQTGAAFTISAYNILSVKNDITVEANGTLNIKSDANGAAAFIPEGNISGNIDIQRYFPTIGGTPTNGNWHYFSPPISDMTSSSFMDQYLMYWDEPTTYWNYILNTDEQLIPGKGYGVLLQNSYGNTINMNGTINNTDIQSPVLKNTTGAGWQGWNLVGNPYSASLDWSIVQASLPAGIDQGIHYWDSQNDQYVYYNNGNGTASQYIPPMQGFFIHCTQNNVQFTIPANARTSQGVDIFYKAGEGKPFTTFQAPAREHNNRLVISSISHTGKTDKAFLEFQRKATPEFDPQYDAIKFYSSNDSLVEIGLPFNNILYSINLLPESILEGRYDLKVKYGINDTYTLSFDGIDSFEDNQPILLFDKQTQVYYDLRAKNNLVFMHNSSDLENRFEIVFDNYLQIPDLANNDDWLIFSRDGKLNIRNKQTEVINSEYLVQIYSTDGRLISEFQRSEEIVDLNLNLSSGIYLVKLISESSQINNKIWLSK